MSGDKIKWLFCWLAQPSTIKALGGVAAGLGYAVTQKNLEVWTAGAVAFGVLVNGLYDNVPRVPSSKSCQTSEQTGADAPHPTQ